MAAQFFQPTTAEGRSAYNLEDQERMTRAKNYFAWQGRLVLRELGRRVVEVGCGVGNFTRLLLDREAVVGVDIDPGCIRQLIARYGNHANLHAFTCDVASPQFAALGRFRPDSCVCLNVLEHVADDRMALDQMASILVPGGTIALMVPAFPALYGPIDRNLGHHRRYTRGGLARLGEAAGLRLVRARYMNAIGWFGWWANAHVLRRQAQSERQIAIFDRWVVPAAARLEDAARPPFGQSLVAVLRKP